MATKPVLETEQTTIQVEQDRFYRDRLGFLFLLIGLLVAVLGLLLVLLLKMQSLRAPPPVFFKASANAELIQEVPLDQANMSANLLFNWLVEGMISVHSFNFVNYGTRLDAAQEYFTPEGYDSFTQALKDNHIFEQLIKKKCVFRGLPTAAPQIIKEGVLANRYLWKLKFPMNFQYRSVTESLFDIAELTILVVRVPTSVSPYGVKVLRYELVLRKTKE